jgi:transcriptional regulator with XRE-family HTH domain
MYYIYTTRWAASMVDLQLLLTFGVNGRYTSGMAKEGKSEPSMDRVRALFKESGLSLVELGRRMGYAEETARQAAWQFMKSHDPRLSMLRKFADAMGVQVEQLTPRGKRMTRKLEVELSDCGCNLEPAAFRDLLEERKAMTSPTWTIDDLVCHPGDAQSFCESIRAELKCPKMGDYLILRTLMNARRSHTN